MNSLNNNHKIYFRLDCGGLIGYGHLSRCLSLAEEFSRNGIEPVFIIRKRPSLSLALPFKIHWLKEAEDVSSLKTEEWKVGSEEDELEEILPVLDNKGVVVLDHYALNIIWQKGLSDLGHKIILFQDSESSSFSASVLINYNFGAENLYKNFKEETVYLLGPSCAPLNLAYSSEHVMRFSPNTIVKNIGLYLGGVKQEFLERVVDSIKDVPYFTGKTIEWVINNKEEEALIQRKLQNLNVITHIRLPGLIPLYKRTDLFIGACGVSFLERACMGIWQINFLVADNQNAAVEAISREKFGFIVGDIRNMHAFEIKTAIENLVEVNHQTITKIVDKSFTKVSGKGVQLIVENCLGVIL